MKTIIVDCRIYESYIREDGGEMFQFIGSSRMKLEQDKNKNLTFKSILDFTKKKFWFTFETIKVFIGGLLSQKDYSDDGKRRENQEVSSQDQ